jgi:hypothetical protein
LTVCFPPPIDQDWYRAYDLTKARRLHDEWLVHRPMPAYMAARLPMVEVRGLGDGQPGAAGRGDSKRRADEDEGLVGLGEQVVTYALQGMRAELFRELMELVEM